MCLPYRSKPTDHCAASKGIDSDTPRTEIKKAGIHTLHAEDLIGDSSEAVVPNKYYIWVPRAQKTSEPSRWVQTCFLLVILLLPFLSSCYFDTELIFFGMDETCATCLPQLYVCNLQHPGNEVTGTSIHVLNKNRTDKWRVKIQRLYAWLC